MHAIVRTAAFAAALIIAASVHAQQEPQPAPVQPAVSQPGQPAPIPPSIQPAQPPGVRPAQPFDSTAHRHLGFFIRPDLGLGYMSTSEPTGTSLGDMTISGAAGLFGVVIGGAVSENVIVAGHIYDAVIVDPTVSFSSGASSGTSNVRMAMFGLGPSVTYYWMPSNIYFTGSLAVTRLRLSDNGRDIDSEYGIGGRFGAGKEWWVSDHWGLGVAGHVSLSSNKDTGSSNPPTLTTWAFGVTFSATYN
jgi:hypothetical protein